MSKTLRNLNWILSTQFGMDFCRFFRSLRGLPPYLKDWLQFRKNYTAGQFLWKPCLHDRYDEGGTTQSEYFWQDLLVARWIFDDRPQKHVDVGSRVDGFVAHVASFREIEVFDVRPITTQIPGVVFHQADLMQPSDLLSAPRDGYCDSISCLHAIEHFGLGRYGDPIDPKGYERGIANMSHLLKHSGKFYLSTPIGVERVEFNAHRVFDPQTIIDCAELNGMQLKQLMVMSEKGVVREVQPTEETLRELAQRTYNLGIFVFLKT